MATNKTKLNYLYDEEADILYLSKGTPSEKDFSNEVDDGVIARLDPKTKAVRGLTILDFAKRSKKTSRTIKLPFDVAFG